MVGEQLQGDDLQDRQQKLWGLRDLDGVLDETLDLLVALDGDGNHTTRARGDLLNVAEGLLVLEDGGGVGGVGLLPSRYEVLRRGRH